MTVIGHQGKMLWILLFTRRATLAQGFENYAQLFRTLFFECVLLWMGGEILCHIRKGSESETSYRLHICALNTQSLEGDANI